MRKWIAKLSLVASLPVLGLPVGAGAVELSDNPFANMQKVELSIAKTADDCIEVRRLDGRPLAIVAYGFTRFGADLWLNLCIAQSYLSDQAVGKDGLGRPHVFDKAHPLCAFRSYAGFRKVAAGATLLGETSLDCRSDEPQRGRSYGLLLYQSAEDAVRPARGELAYGMARFTIEDDGSVRQLH